MEKQLDRSTIIFAGVLLVGVLTVLILQFTGGNDVVEIKAGEESAVQSGIYDKLKKDIENLNEGSFSPQKFDIIEGSIQGSLAAELITEPAANALRVEYRKVFEIRVYSQCEQFLRSGIGSSTQIQQWLNLLQNKIGPNGRISTYRQQIHWYQYYLTTLPKKVNDFVQSGIGSYEESRYQNLKNEVLNMPGLSPAYKSTSKFKNLSTSLIADLYQFNYEYNK